MNPPGTRNITEWIGVFQWEEYGSRHADVQQGQAMAHFNDFLARYGELPAKGGGCSRAYREENRAMAMKGFG